MRPYGRCTRKVSEIVSGSGGLKMAKGASGEQKALRRGEQCSPTVVCRAHGIKERCYVKATGAQCAPLRTLYTKSVRICFRKQRPKEGQRCFRRAKELRRGEQCSPAVVCRVHGIKNVDTLRRRTRNVRPYGSTGFLIHKKFRIYSGWQSPTHAWNCCTAQQACQIWQAFFVRFAD